MTYEHCMENIQKAVEEKCGAGNAEAYMYPLEWYANCGRDSIEFKAKFTEVYRRKKDEIVEILIECKGNLMKTINRIYACFD